MDLEEVYLRQIDQKLKRQNQLQEENNELLKALLKALSKQGDNNMHKILATTFILTLTTCYPVHADRLQSLEINKIWVDGEVIASSPMETKSLNQSSLYAVIKMEDEVIHHCYSIRVVDFII